MKKTTWIILLVFGVVFSLQAQQKVKERDLKGEWKMVFDFDEEDIEEGIEEESVLGWMFSESVSGFVMNILDDIDIQMEFLSSGKVRMVVVAFGEEEVEYLEWRITRDGELIMSEDGEDEDDVWMLDNRKLVSYEKDSRGELDPQPVYLVRK